MEHHSGNLWFGEDLDLLASDLDSSLSGLGGSYDSKFDMSETLSAIQVIKMHKEESQKDHWMHSISFQDHISQGLNKEKAHSMQDLTSWNVSKSLSFPTLPEAKMSKKHCRDRQACYQEGESRYESHNCGAESASGFQAPFLSNTFSRFAVQPGTIMKGCSRAEFQYILAAPTALGSRIGAATVTYLNQGQAYEIRLIKMYDISEMRGKLLKSVLRVGFEDRRLQFREKLEMIAWQSHRSNDRILDIDLSLSYGIFDVIPDPENINCCEFMWDPTREASVFFKINCISTEFTSKRRGGEKGVPFRITMETYSHWENPARKLDAACCVVKVFKSKGADRKHKTDKEKFEKLSQAEQYDFQPSYQCTVFIPCSTASEMSTQSYDTFSPSCGGSVDSKPESPVASTAEVTTSTPSIAASPQHNSEMRDNEGAYYPDSDESCSPFPGASRGNHLTVCMSAADVQIWLSQKKFAKYLSCFSLYSAKELLSLSREDMIEICGPADGIRLYNNLQIREPPPLRKLYISKDKLTFNAVFLYSFECRELTEELAKVFGLSEAAVTGIYVTGPEGILLVVTDKVLQNIRDESTYTCELMKAEENSKFSVILRSYVPTHL